MVTHFNATLGRGGWLDLAQQGLSPCKKYKASWRSSAKKLPNYQSILPATALLQALQNFYFTLSHNTKTVDIPQEKVLFRS